MILGIILIGMFMYVGCSDDDTIIENPTTPKSIEIEDFIWNGLNIFYLWQESVDDLSDDRFSTQTEYEEYLQAAPEPEEFFESLIYNRENVDHWSWIVDDYIELERSFQGISKSNGVDFRLSLISNDSDDIIGFVRYILPNSDASDKDIKRGDVFTHVDGQQLNRSNYSSLLFGEADSYVLSLANIENGEIVPSGKTVDLTKFEYTENPVFLTTIIKEGGHKIGYIVYNAFTRNFDNELNAAFLELKNEGITDLVMDFRYNPGGSVSTAVAMASMITGQFKGEVFSKEKWNTKLQTEIENSNPSWLVNNFSDKMSNGNSINSLTLNKVHIIVTDRSASASELIINGLRPYINVTLVGEKTVGKYTASITLYDSPDFGREGANEDHFYAMQPIVLETVNKLDENDKDGFEPNINQPEYISTMGVLGDSNEPLLRATLDNILGIASKTEMTKKDYFKKLSSSKDHTLLKDNMYIDKEEVRKMIKNSGSHKK